MILLEPYALGLVNCPNRRGYNAKEISESPKAAANLQLFGEFPILSWIKKC